MICPVEYVAVVVLSDREVVAEIGQPSLTEYQQRPADPLDLADPPLARSVGKCWHEVAAFSNLRLAEKMLQKRREFKRKAATPSVNARR